MKSILFISINDHVPWGGSEVLWSKTALQLSENNDIKVLIKKWEHTPKPIEKLIDNGVNVIYKQPPKKHTFFSKVKGKLFGLKPKFIHDLELPEIGIPKLVVISLGNHIDRKLLYYTDYLIEKKIPFVLIYQLVSDLRGYRDEVTYRFRNAMIAAKKLYVLSDENKLKLELQFAYDFPNIEMIFNPFNYNAQYLNLELNDKSNFNLALVGAYICFHKGQDILLKVLSLDKWKQRNWNLNLYGSGANERQINDLIRLYGLKDKVFCKGFVGEKTDIWRENHVCIMPSRMEGQSLAMLEAMSYGRMVISTKVGDAERLVKPNETGFLIEAPTVELLDKGLEEAWLRRNDWIKIGKASRAHLYNVIREDPVIDFSGKLEKLL